MKDVIRVMAKEIRRVRALAEVAEKYGITHPRTQLECMKRILAMMIKSEIT